MSHVNRDRKGGMGMWCDGLVGWFEGKNDCCGHKAPQWAHGTCIFEKFFASLNSKKNNVVVYLPSGHYPHTTILHRPNCRRRFLFSTSKSFILYSAASLFRFQLFYQKQIFSFNFFFLFGFSFIHKQFLISFYSKLNNYI